VKPQSVHAIGTDLRAGSDRGEFGPTMILRKTPTRGQRPAGSSKSSSRRVPSTRRRRPTVATVKRLVREWHPTLNGDLSPRDFTLGMTAAVWWKCPKGPDHEWCAPINSRARGNGCPFCALHNHSITNSLSSRRPDLALEWHPTRNGRLRPEDVSYRTHRRVWWRCSKDLRHVWSTELRGRRRCPFCVGQRVLPETSLANVAPAIAETWHPILNGSLTPVDVLPGSSHKIWWKCPNGPDHVFRKNVWARVRQENSCPFCRGDRLSVTNSLAGKRPDLAAQWHPTKNGELRPENIYYRSHRRVWWKCPKGPDHEWKTIIESRSRFAKGGCPFCSHRRLSITNCLLTLLPRTAAEWHPTKNRPLTPRHVSPGDMRVAWWRCQWRHEWKTRIHSRSKGSGCPVCFSLSRRGRSPAVRPKVRRKVWMPADWT
jgi:hypothetical protein